MSNFLYTTIGSLMANNYIVEWHPSYSIGINLIDKQHMELINLTNRLFRSCMSGQGRTKSIFIDSLHDAVDYVGYHFGTEEKIMERVNYPEFREHKKQHTDFVKEVFIKVDDFNSGKYPNPISFVYFLKEWVLHHIAVRDKKLGEYLLALRKSGELRKITVKVKEDKSTHRREIQ